MTKSLRHWILGIESNDSLQPSRTSPSLAVRRLGGTRYVVAALVPFQNHRIDCDARNEQVNVVANQFMAALRNYTKAGEGYRQKQRAWIEGKFKDSQYGDGLRPGGTPLIFFPCVVKPNATPEEVTAVVENTDGTGGQIFSQAVCMLVHRLPRQNLPICGLKSFRRMVNPEHRTRKFRIVTKISRRLSARSKSSPNCTMAYISPCYSPVLTANM